MAVEATHLNLFTPQQQQQKIISINHQGNGLSYNNTRMAFPNFQMCDPVQPKTCDSGLTNNLLPTANVTTSRKRSFNNCSATSSPSSCVGGDVLPLLQQYHFDIDHIISHHTKKIRVELEERQKQQARVLVTAIGEGVKKKLKEKDEQIQRMGKINLVLQEKVKSLYVENQLWREMAQTNEATANSLRTNLEQVLAHVSDERLSAGAAAVEEDVESCCGSSDHEEAEGRTLAGDAQDNRMCKRCGERESSVLLLPCRHLCLCGVCGSTLLHACPVCNSNMNGTVHVNISS